ncbi:MAG: dihydroorotate dehydrogenase electron transfer subunit [Candidatus Lokiarchaeota archaeon]|nr:dihydroorotate dehydrogenase electron transfer subunit [Candidatus Lokiarchaeota archaeon]
MAAKSPSINKPLPVRITGRIQETPRIATLEFAVPGVRPVPGQFFMVWIPGVDEIPMSVASIDNDRGIYAVSVAAVGEATAALFAKDVGDKIGIRGPFGNGFDVSVGDGGACIIGGGVGMAALKPLVSVLLEQRKNLIVINAARTKSELLYHESFEKSIAPGMTYFISTDDGTCGEKCLGHELLVSLLGQGKIRADKVYTCGPELMMRQVFLACKERAMRVEASLERMMRCGSGLCGLCALDPGGLLVCKDGPVFSGDQLGGVTEFGNYKRDLSGKRIPLKK